MFSIKKYAVFAAASLAALAISCGDDSEPDKPSCADDPTQEECGTPLVFKITDLSSDATNGSGKSRGDVSTGTTYSSTEFEANMSKINVIGGSKQTTCGDAVYAPGYEACDLSASVDNLTTWFLVESADEATFKGAVNAEDIASLKDKYNKQLPSSTATEKVELVDGKVFLVDHWNGTKDEMWVVKIEDAKKLAGTGTAVVGSSVKLKSYKLGEF
jgi:hypothetical protein